MKYLLTLFALCLFTSCSSSPSNDEEAKVALYYRWEQQAHKIHILEGQDDIHCFYCGRDMLAKYNNPYWLRDEIAWMQLRLDALLDEEEDVRILVSPNYAD